MAGLMGVVVASYARIGLPKSLDRAADSARIFIRVFL
jgi:hypothetical protein